MSRKKWVDPRKELKKLAKKTLASIGLRTASNNGQELAKIVLRFLKREDVTIVMCDDKGGMTATAHPSPHYARLEMISCMLDTGGRYFANTEDGHEFLELVRDGKFKAAIDFWNSESAELGSDGVYYGCHDGKVEKNHTVEDLKERAREALDDERKLGRYKPREDDDVAEDLGRMAWEAELEEQAVEHGADDNGDEDE